MHCLNLCIGYGVGLKENVIYRVVTDPVTKAKMKKRIFMTEGGAFPEGFAVIRKLRALNKFFANTVAVQRGHKLTEVQQLHGLPEISGPIDIDVRVESVVKLFQRSIVNYTAYQWYFRTVPDAKKDMEVFICISTAEWELVVEMEAIVQRVAELALVESQAANTLSPTLYILLRVASTRINSYKFSAYQLNSPRDKATTDKTFPRVELLYCDISDLGHRCIARTEHQIAFTLPKPSVQMGMALLLDPRTKRSAKNYLKVPDTPDSHTAKIMDDTMSLLYMEHRELYKRKYGSNEQGHDGASSASSSPSVEILDLTESEMKLLCGEEVSEQTEQSVVESTLYKEADALVDKWLALRIEWAEVAKKQYPKKEEGTAVLSKLLMATKSGKRVWNVKRLC
ncbi:hypothetical protein PI125_g9092 [Phytophthora idaei]|nr:hypothetical protein PI125_g9092 [Phytophthora idaei]KAG3157257.1 hypothetical protein PI126_g8397 [Phytophthora idaei]